MGKEISLYNCFSDLLNAQKKDNAAIIYDRDEKINYLSYAELIRKIDEYPTNPGSSIGILCENNLETILAIFAYAKRKKQIVLLNPLEDISILKEQIRASDVDYLVGEKELVDSLDPFLVHSDVMENGNILFFTSGTTSSSKAVILTESSLCASAYNGGSLLALNEDDTLLSVLPLNHVFGFVCSLLWGLSFGAKVALGRGKRHLVDDGSHFKATVISLVPQLADFFSSNNIFNKELRLVLIGAGSCQKETIDSIKRKGIQVAYGYGLTETSSGVALSIGEDPNLMTICPLVDIKVASDGEILLKSDECLLKGYYKDSDKTESSFMGAYFKTGDLGKIKDGCLCLTGRKKDIFVLSSGNKIFCEEYESKLKRYLKNIDFAINLENSRITLYIYSEKKEIDIEARVNEFNKCEPLERRIARIVYRKEKIPKTLNGKIQRWKLSED